MKTKLLPPILSCLVLASFLCRGNAQTADDFNDGLTATSPSPDVVKVSWWGSDLWTHRVDVTEDLDSMQWTALPELFLGTDAPIELNFTITGGNGDRMFYRVIKRPFFVSDDSNMLVHDMRFIGEKEMRTVFSDGLDFFPNDEDRFFDSGVVFSTGLAERWNHEPSGTGNVMSAGWDVDLHHWMTNHGFFKEMRTQEHYDVGGVEVEFSVDFGTSSAEAGILKVPFIFASDEYYRPLEAKDDAMAVFLFELDEEGEAIPATRVNLGVLPDTETHTRAMNVFNVGEVVPPPGHFENNLNESGFVKNSSNEEHYEDPKPPEIPPFDLNYSGFTEKIVASGGTAAVYDDVAVNALFRQANTNGMGAGASNGDRGWGGIVMRGAHLPYSSNSQEPDFRGYVVGFGLEDNDVVFTLYKMKEHSTDDQGWETRIFPDAWVSSVANADIRSVPVAGFQENKWYWISAEVEGDVIRAKYWEKGTSEPGWIIEESDTEGHLESGFSGLINMDTSLTGEEASEVHWDKFEIQTSPGFSTDFSSLDAGKGIPKGWTSFGQAVTEWEVIKDEENAEGGRYLRHSEGSESVGHVSILKPNWPEKVEDGKRYLLKIVLGDELDSWFDSALFLEESGVKVVPD